MPGQSPRVTVAVCVHECKLTMSMREMLHFIKIRNKKIHSKMLVVSEQSSPC